MKLNLSPFKVLFLLLIVAYQSVNAQNVANTDEIKSQLEVLIIDSLPEKLPLHCSIPISFSGEKMTMELEKCSVFGKNTRFLIDDGTGKLVETEKPKESTYTGHVKEHSKFYVNAVITDNGLIATIVKSDSEMIEVRPSIEGGKTHEVFRVEKGNSNLKKSEGLIPKIKSATNFSSSSQQLVQNESDTSTASLPPTTVMDVLEYEIGVEIGSLSFFGSAYNGVLATAQASAQSIIGNLNRRFLHGSGVKFVLGTVIIRTDANTDPLRHIGGDGNSIALLNGFGDYWNNHPEIVGSTHDLAVYHVKAAPSGLSWTNGLATNHRYAMMAGNGATSWADGTATHEVGHSFNLKHVSDSPFFYENRPRVNSGSNMSGGRDYYISVMHGSGNHNIGRFATGEARVVRATLNRKRAAGTPTSNPGKVCPFGVYDEFQLKSDDTITIDVIANDYDMNNDVLDVRILDQVSFLGGAISLSEGTGPGGRNELVYAPPAAGLNGKDFFHYTVFDTTGLTDFGAVYVYKETSLFNEHSDQFRFDFGTQTSTVFDDYDRVYSNTSNDLYGWVNSPNLSDRDRGTEGGANDLNRDLCHSSEPGTFETNLPNGKWEVLITFGDKYAHDGMYVKAQGVDRLENISNVPNVFFNKTFEVDVTEGKLSLEFSDRGGSDVNWAVTRVVLTHLNALGVENNDRQDVFSLYPNPTSSVLNIKTTANGDWTLSIVDMLGKTMYTNSKDNSGVGGEITVNVDGWSKGVYFVEFKFGNSKTTDKFIVN